MLVEAGTGGFSRGGTGHATVAAVLADERAARAIAAEIAAAEDFAWVDAPEIADLLVVDPAGLAGASAAAVVLVGAPPGTMVRAPVRALLPAGAGAPLVLAALRLVAAGLTVAPAGPDGRRGTAGEDGEGEPLPRLTPRESEVLKLLADGASNKLIARRLDISVHTAKFHVASVLQKLQASGRLEAVGIGLRSGLLML